MASTGLRIPSDRFLPPDPRVEEPYRITPGLALRIGILSALALAGFALLFLRLWALQVLSGPQYLHAAQNNQLRTVRVEAPRGPILDRDGRVLVSNVPGTAVRIWPADLPKEKSERLRELRRLSEIVHVPLRRIVTDVKKRAGDPLTPVTVKTAVHEDQVGYLYENSRDFPGVEIVQTYLRRYEYQSLAAQILGHVGEISAEQLKRKAKAGYRPGDKIGQGGVESAFDGYLRGRPGLAQLRVDSLGRPRSELTLRQQPQAGNAIRLTIDIDLQRAAEQALRYGIELARGQGHWAANGGAIVALDPRNGAVLAMASNPTYKPSVYVGRVQPAKLAPLVSPRAAKPVNYPSLNRASAGLYPPGSAFKPVTALAALQEHILSPYESLACTGEYEVAGQTFRNWDPYADAPMTLPTALAASCDTYFYQLGYEFYGLPPERGSPLQKWAAQFGFGKPTGLDIGGEERGLLPTPAWRRATYTKKTDPCCWQVDRLWKPGDSIQLSIGQKDLLVTPLQMARFFALIANGGRLVTPYVVADVEQPGNKGAAVVLDRFDPPTPKPSGVDPSALAVVRDGLYLATHAPYGTSSGVFGSFPVPIAGKTGTAEKAVDVGFTTLMDQSWWCGYGPADDARIVVCALIENGGHGGSAAAPAALQVFEQFFGVEAGALTYVPSD